MDGKDLWYHLVQRRWFNLDGGAQNIFGDIFNKISFAEDGVDKVSKLTVSMDLTIEIGIGNDEEESLRW